MNFPQPTKFVVALGSLSDAKGQLEMRKLSHWNHLEEENNTKEFFFFFQRCRRTCNTDGKESIVSLVKKSRPPFFFQ